MIKETASNSKHNSEILLMLDAGRLVYGGRPGFDVEVETATRQALIDQIMWSPLKAEIRKALIKRRPITFSDNARNLTIRWKPGAVH